jgi:hypothetical protein
MANETGNELRRPIPLALAGIAAIGWLSAVYVWWQASETESQIATSLHAAEQARESLAADLQKLQKTAGAAADLVRKRPGRCVAEPEPNPFGRADRYAGRD